MNKRVVGKPWIGRKNAVDLFFLTRSKGFVWIQTPDTFQQSLPSQHLVAPRNAPCEVICDVEECCIRIGNLRVKRHKIGGYRFPGGHILAAFKEFHGFLGPDRPMPKQPAPYSDDNRFTVPYDCEGGNKIGKNMIVIPSIESNSILSACCDNASDYIKCAIAVEALLRFVELF